uniref:Uncharacterized protein n=1 Tax=Lepeophtheirus salmonis TaxID=72036 RepID=A0A0K2VBV9_LEPSM
MIFFTRRRNIV